MIMPIVNLKPRKEQYVRYSDTIALFFALNPELDTSIGRKSFKTTDTLKFCKDPARRIPVRKADAYTLEMFLNMDEFPVKSKEVFLKYFGGVVSKELKDTVGSTDKTMEELTVEYSHKYCPRKPVALTRVVRSGHPGSFLRNGKNVVVRKFFAKATEAEKQTAIEKGKNPKFLNRRKTVMIRDGFFIQHLRDIGFIKESKSVKTVVQILEYVSDHSAEVLIPNTDICFCDYTRQKVRKALEHYGITIDEEALSEVDRNYAKILNKARKARTFQKGSGEMREKCKNMLDELRAQKAAAKANKIEAEKFETAVSIENKIDIPALPEDWVNL